MLNIPSNIPILLCTHPVDIRKSFNGLTAYVRTHLGSDPGTGSYFVFGNKTGTLMKILYWDRDGYAIWYKRLEQGTFRFPKVDPDTAALEITLAELNYIFEGIDFLQLPKRKRYSKEAALPPLAYCTETVSFVYDK